MGKSRVLVIGGGGREHALCLGLNKSNKVGKIFCSPGNAGTAMIADNVDLDITNNSIITKYCLEKSIDLVIVGP
ncbi:MAG: phosphoribosylamine--glycine ligase N-terminal domain-containing protein, partial [Candidatus Thermoplasmatota archaeon]|nr:phosphoribosylamine--glycine ligase N-terminal domain-containing protein [Candidatus Thermoplasmatota archaeon]